MILQHCICAAVIHTARNDIFPSQHMLSNLLTALEYQHGMLPLARHFHDLAKLNDLALVLYPWCGLPPLAWPYHDLAKLNDLAVVLYPCRGLPPLAWPYHDLTKLNDLAVVLYPCRGTTAWSVVVRCLGPSWWSGCRGPSWSDVVVRRGGQVVVVRRGGQVVVVRRGPSWWSGCRGPSWWSSCRGPSWSVVVQCLGQVVVVRRGPIEGPRVRRQRRSQPCRTTVLCTIKTVKCYSRLTNSSHSMFGPCCWVHKGLSSLMKKGVNPWWELGQFFVPPG